MRASTRFAPCALAEMHRCLAPCDGRVGPERYEELVRSLISSLSTPGGLLGTLEARMRDLAEQERFEEAALARDRLRALAEALASEADRRLAPRRTDDLVLRDAAGHRIRLRRGGLIRDAGDEPLGGAVSARARGRALRAPGVGGSQRRPRRVERRAVRRARRRRRRAPPAPRDAPRPGADGRRTLGRRLDWRAMETAVILEGARTPIGRFLGFVRRAAGRRPRRARGEGGDASIRTSSPTRSTRRSSVTLARRATARTPAAR